MSPEAIARVVAAAHEFVAAQAEHDQERMGRDWNAAHIRLDNAWRELRASCGFEEEQ